MVLEAMSIKGGIELGMPTLGAIWSRTLVVTVASLFAQTPRCAASASCANPDIYVKKSDDWPMKSPMSVRNFRAPMATPSVLVGRMIETIGKLILRKGQGSGMIRLVW